MHSDAQAMRIANLNARIDRLPSWSLSYGVLVLVGVAYFFAFYDILTISFTLPTLTKFFHMQGYQIAYPVTANLFGYVIGAYILGNVADIIGRRRAMLVTVGILALGSLLAAFSTDVTTLTIYRFITGLGMGAELSLAATIITELSPAGRRGKYMQANYLWGGFGLGVTPFLALWLLGTGADGWRLIYAFGALVALVSIFARKNLLPESPRWLVLHGREEEAEQMVQKMEANATRRFGSLPELPPPVAEASESGFPTAFLFKAPYLGRLLVTLAFWLVWYITVYAYLGYEPTLLIKQGMSTPNGLLFSALGDIAIPLGAVIVYLLIDKFERKVTVSSIAFIFAIALVLMAINANPVLTFIGSFFSAMMIAANSAAYVYTAEAFPTRARATATSIGDGVGHVGGAVAPFIVVWAMSALGASGTFGLLAGIVALSGVIILSLGIRTVHLRLQEIAS
ncbi:MAG: MFS transporter [Thermaerobacter sp.]|nr:MFS transporter [Thermaerobacter sp.]